MAKQVSVIWLQNKQFVGVDSSKHSVVISSHDEENNIGVGPSELLLLAVGSCSGYDVVNILTRKRQKLTGLVINVTGEQEADPPWPYRKITVEYIVRGQGLKEKAVADAIELSEIRYCSVAATIKPTAEIVTTYQIVEDE